MRKGRVVILGLIMTLALTGCGKKEETPSTKVTKITNVSNVSFEIPTSLKDGAEDYNTFEKNKATVVNDFDYGTVEKKTIHEYQLTDYETFYLYCADNYQFSTNITYIQNDESVQTELNNKFEDVVISNTHYLHQDNVTEVVADIAYTPVFSDDINTRKIENASGKLILYGIDEKQYLFVYVDNENKITEDDCMNIINSFNYTGEESSLYKEDDRKTMTYGNKKGGINLSYNVMGIDEGEKIKVPSCNALITTNVYASETDHELTPEEQIKQITKEEVDTREIVWKDTEVSNNNTLTWQGRTFYITDIDSNQYYQCIYVTSIGKTIITVSAQYTEEDNEHLVLLEDTNNCIKDLIRNSALTQYVGLDGSVVSLISEPTTEITTEEPSTEVSTETSTEVPTTEATTENTTEITTEVTTESNTEAATEITTESTTETTQVTTQTYKPTTKKQPVTEKKATEKRTTEKKTTKKKKSNNDLDVEW